MAVGSGDSADSTVSTVLSEWLIVVLIVFSTVFEYLLHRVEHWILHKHNHLQAVVRTLYRELMVLGIVSFLFILYELIIHPSARVILSFEFAHLFIFLFAVFYTIVIMSTMFTSLRLSARWKHMEQIELVKYLHLKDQYARMRTRLHMHSDASWRLIRWWFPNVMLPWRYWQLHEIMAFHDIRFQFIFYRNLPDHFRFSSFLRKIKSATFIELVESHWSLYTIFLALVLADIIRREITDPGDDLVFETSFHIAAAVVLALFVQILDVKIRRIYWELTKHPRIYYEGLKPAHVAEELAAAGNRLAAERARRRSRSSDLLAEEDAENLADDEATDVNRLSSAAESEMLGPMHGPKLSWENLRHSTEDSPASRLSSYKPRPSVDAFMSKVAPPKPVDIARGHHHSLDLDRSLRSIVSQQPNETIHTDLTEALNNAPLETEEVTAANNVMQRRSVETAHQSEIIARPVPSRNAKIAKAAVEAARRRSLDKPSSRGRSLDSAEPDELTPDKSGLRFFKKGWTSRGASTDEDGRNSHGEFPKGLVDVQSRRSERVSIDLVAAMPREELAERNLVHAPHHFGDTRLDMNSDLDEGTGTSGRDTSRETRKSGSSERRMQRIRFSVGNEELREDVIERNEVENEKQDVVAHPSFIQRHKSLAFLNATILKNLEHQENAKKMTPTKYPWWVIKLIPRLGRVASPVEKLFWFGSHKLFLWCVEFTLFFSTVLQAAASATLSLELIESEEVGGLVIASFVLAVLSLLFVLFRIAGVIKRYIFILHNASLVPEEMALEAIYDVSKKRAGRWSSELSDISGSEAEKEEAEVAKEKRRKLGRFFQSEAASGNMPGIEAADGRASMESGEERPTRRIRMRKLALRRRRARAESSHIPVVPVEAETALESE